MLAESSTRSTAFVKARECLLTVWPLRTTRAAKQKPWNCLRSNLCLFLLPFSFPRCSIVDIEPGLQETFKKHKIGMDTFLFMDFKLLCGLLQISGPIRRILSPHIERLRAETFAQNAAPKTVPGLFCASLVVAVC